MAAVWAAGPEPMMATLVWGTLDMLEGGEKLAEWEEKEREAATAENGFLCAAVGLGLCWKADVTATERLRLERRGWRKGRRNVEENSLKVVMV